jgi:hypothetical protein
LAENEEVPETGFSAQKVAGNRARWRKEQLKAHTEWAKLHNTAQSAIYHSCKPAVQQMIAGSSTAKEQWNILEKAYSSVGFGNVILQLNV